MSSSNSIIALYEKGFDVERIANKFRVSRDDVQTVIRVHEKCMESKKTQKPVTIKKPPMTSLIVGAIKKITGEVQGRKFTNEDIFKVVREHTNTSIDTVQTYMSPGKGNFYGKWIRSQVPFYSTRSGRNVIFYYGKEPEPTSVPRVMKNAVTKQETLPSVPSIRDVRTISNPGSNPGSGDLESLVTKLLNESLVIEEYMKDQIMIQREQIELQKKTYELFSELKTSGGKQPAKS
jgi:hypothetical protein